LSAASRRQSLVILQGMFASQGGRHTALTHQAQAGVELRYLAKTARHSRRDTTARYLHAEADEWRQQIAAHRLGEQ